MRKNILIFSHGYQYGFMEATNQYTRLFDQNNYDVTVVYLAGQANEETKKQHLAKNIIFLNASTKNKRGFKFPIIKTMLAMHKEKKFQIVICHRYKPTYIMLWVNVFHKIPNLIGVMHDMGIVKNRARRWLFSLLGKKNTILAGVSNAVRDDLKNSLSSRLRVTTLYNVINIEEAESQLVTKSNARQQLNIEKDTFLFGTLGRLVEAKDHCTLIEAFSLIQSRCIKAKLVIIGEGELKSTLQQQISQLGLENHIVLTGFLPNASSMLTAFDTFVLSSQREAFGRVLLEAMVAKCPLIGTETNGIPEVLGNIGALVQKQNPQALARAMMKFYKMSDEERQRQAELSYQRANNIFSLTSFKENFWKLMTEI